MSHKTLEFRAIGCEMLAIVNRDAASVERLLAATPGWFESWEHLSRFRADSD